MLAAERLRPRGASIRRSLPAASRCSSTSRTNYRWIATLVATHNQDPQFLRQAVKCRIDGLMFRPAGSAAEFVEQVVLLAKAVNATPPSPAEARAGDRRPSRRRRDRLRRRAGQAPRRLRRAAHPDAVARRGRRRRERPHGRGAQCRCAARRAARDGQPARHRTSRDGAETISIIEAAIRELHPTHVYTHSLEDTHQDHRAVHAASLVAARGVPNVYCYQTPSSTVEFKPHRFVDITALHRARRST